MENVKSIWEQVLQMIEDEITPVAYRTWFVPIKPISMKDGVFEVAVSDNVHQSMVSRRYSSLIENILYEITGADYEFSVILEETKPVQKVVSKENLGLPLNKKYTFDTFVVGNSNKFAHAAAVAVAEAPATAWNPLFLYGGVGLGKTHLLHAIGNYISENNPDLKVMYITSETFTIDLINSLNEKNNEEFRSKYRSIDVLMVDDIQFIAGKDRTQEEFFHTFNTLYNENKQIIITADKPARKIQALEERLVSRFEWGLAGDLYSPDFETRVAILKQKAELENVEISNDVIMFLAEKVESNIRELEGYFNKITAYKKLTGNEVTVNDIFKIIDITRPALNEDVILDCCARFYNVSAENIMGKIRTDEITHARHIVMYLLKEMIGMPQLKIGKFMNKDNSTVIHGIKKIKEELETNPKTKSEIENLKKDIRGE